MLDYYSSSFAIPSKEEVIQEVLKEINEEKIVRSLIEPMPCLGSLMGWALCVKPNVIQKVKNRVHNKKVEAYWVHYVMRKIIGDNTFTY
jgi:hypothetical protein